MSHDGFISPHQDGTSANGSPRQQPAPANPINSLMNGLLQRASQQADTAPQPGEQPVTAEMISMITFLNQNIRDGKLTNAAAFPIDTLQEIIRQVNPNATAPADGRCPQCHSDLGQCACPQTSNSSGGATAPANGPPIDPSRPYGDIQAVLDQLSQRIAQAHPGVGAAVNLTQPIPPAGGQTPVAPTTTTTMAGAGLTPAPSYPAVHNLGASLAASAGPTGTTTPAAYTATIPPTPNVGPLVPAMPYSVPGVNPGLTSGATTPMMMGNPMQWGTPDGTTSPQGMGNDDLTSVMQLLQMQSHMAAQIDQRQGNIDLPKALAKLSQARPFKGETGEAFSDWFPDFHRFLVDNQLKSAYWHSSLVGHLQGPAREWALSHGYMVSANYQHLVLGLAKAYPSPSWMVRQLGFNKQMQAPEMSISEYVQHLRSLASRLYRSYPSEFQERQVLAQLTNGCRPEFRQMMPFILGSTSLVAAQELLQNFENMHDLETIRRAPAVVGQGRPSPLKLNSRLGFPVNLSTGLLASAQTPDKGASEPAKTGDSAAAKAATPQRVTFKDDPVQRIADVCGTTMSQATQSAVAPVYQQILEIQQQLQDVKKAAENANRAANRAGANSGNGTTRPNTVLEKYSKLEEQMQQKRYYPALKTLEQLEHTYFPQLSKYRFVGLLIKQVASIREQIKKASLSELKDFLETIMKVSTRVGHIALRHIAQRNSINSEILSKRKNRYPNIPDTMLNGIDKSSANEEDEFIAQDIVDFQPVYRCCHIFSVLGAKESFEAEYQDARRKQNELALKSPDIMHESLDAYLNYFYEVVGFFVIEDTVMKTAPGLVTRGYRDELWNNAMQQVTKVLNSHFGNCTEAEVMLQIKQLIMLFALCMKEYGFQVHALYKLLQNFRDQYNEILMSQCCVNFEQILRTDNYTPITVHNDKEYAAVSDRFPVHSRTLEQESYPRKFPFSEFVPNIYMEMKNYIKGCYRFTEKLGLSQTDIDDTVRRYTNVLLERLSGCLKSYISNRQLSLIQLVQITINMGYLERSCESLEAYITKLVGISQSSVHAVKLRQGVHMFSDARSEVEHQIYESLNQKMSDFFELANYDWDVQESQGRASGYIMDLIAFLDSTFKSFTNLPPALARAACMSACKHLSIRLMRYLTEPELKAVSPGSLEQFNLDVIQCEQFAAQCPVSGFDEGTLPMTFSDLRQLLDLFMTWDWSTYLADYGQDSSKYVRVPSNTAIILLEKVMESERRRNSLFSRGRDKDKRKLMETVLKQLRSLQAGGE